MPTYQIEMLWRCRVCQAHHINRGLSKHCANCGHPKDDQDEELFPQDITEANALTGENKRKAEAGPDSKCKYCGSLQSALNKCCTECGADKETGAKSWRTKELSISQDMETGQKSEVKSHDVEVSNTGVVTEFESQAQPEPEKQVRTFRNPIKPIWLILSAVALVFGLFLYFIFRTKVVDAHVTATHWDHQVMIDRYQIDHKEGWTPDFDGFNVVPLGQRVHHYDHVKVGSHNEPRDVPYDCNCRTVKGKCYTTPVNCKSNKNGTATCTGGDKTCDPDSTECKTCYKKVDNYVDDYEDKPRYQMWYGWDVWEWRYNRTVTHECDEPMKICGMPSWPTGKELDPPYALRSGEKERSSQEEHYKIVFSEPNGSTHDMNPQTEDEFHRYPIGTTVRLKVGIAHGVEVLRQ